ncbi:hypothetical protein [Bradyrhizobium tropiciagri]|uniref:hypothetical protein n=1 Tax=Bradyrhizobium tropiciagri TaxID=312253 RepID=UPI00067E3EB4|nr:hypothetical protein [Bradyrhizobium tropiciagri]
MTWCCALSPGGKKIRSLPQLKRKKIAVVGDGEKLGYELVRDEIALRRDHLKRRPATRDDNLVVVKTANG